MKKESMTERISCPHCEQVRDVELIEREERVTIKAREVPFTARLHRCATCGTEFQVPGQLDENLATAREAYARLYESPLPEQLVSLRARYGASQKAFGLILGFGELTMNSYEQGAIPSSANRLLLKLVDNPLAFKAMYDLNAARVGALQRQRIESSAGYKSALSWSGLEALAGRLTPLQRAKIEECADCYGTSVPQQVSSYVTERSFEDYAQLFAGATWSGTSVQRAPLSQDARQEAS
jgi:putative zinc finger/helix-turn-helix YgiT family protein